MIAHMCRYMVLYHVLFRPRRSEERLNKIDTKDNIQVYRWLEVLIR